MQHKNLRTHAATAGLLLAVVLVLPASNGLGGIVWTSDGTNSGWEYGPSQEGPSIWATGLGAPHNRPECSWIESVSIPGAALQDDSLVIRHTYDMQHYDPENFQPYAIDGGLAVISKDDGQTWAKVPMDYWGHRLGVLPGYTDKADCIREITGETDLNTGYFTGQASDLTSTGSVGTVEPTDLVRVRLVFFADDEFVVNLVGGTLGRDGWQVQGVTVGGFDLMPFLGVDTNNLPLP